MNYNEKCIELNELYARTRNLRNEIAKEIDGVIGMYQFHYENKRILENALVIVKEQLESAKVELIVYFESNGISGVKRDGTTLSLSHRAFPKVLDYDSLLEWVEEQDVPQGTFLDIKFNIKKLSSIIKDARVNHPGEEEDYLPPGLSFSVKDIITVRIKE